MRLFIFALLYFSVSLSLSQDVSIGSWREHLPYSQGKSVTESENKVYCATEYSVFSVNKNDNNLSYLNTVNGLSDVGVSVINYHKSTETLLIAYKNANIDLITKSKRIINISDIKRKSIPGNKTINDITFSNDNAYLACGFGIVVLDMEKREINETYIIGPNATQVNVQDIAINDTTIFAATDGGLYYADSLNTNLLDFRNWSRDTNMVKPLANYSEIALFDDYKFVINDNPGYATDTMFYHSSNAGWDYYDTTNIRNLYAIRSYKDRMVIVAGGAVDFMNSGLNNIRKIYTYVDAKPNARDALIGENGWVWIADYSLGLVGSEKEWSYDIITPDGPGYINAMDMEHSSDALWVATGGVDVSWNNLYQRFGIAQFTEGDWNHYDWKEYPVFDSIFDILSVAVDPSDGDHVFAGSWGKGLVEFKDGKVKNVYDDSNSTLETRPANNFIGIGGLAYDEDRNLWVTNSFVSNGLSMRSVNGEWKSFDLRPAVSTNELGEFVIDDYGQKWIVVPRSGGIIVFSDNNTLNNELDDKAKRLTKTEGNGNLPSSNVQCIARDTDGEIWFGTDKGVAVFYSPGNVFSGQNFDAQQIFIPKNDGSNTGTFLLETETVTDILVDGANRKWIGTAKGGLFLMSEEGTEEIHHFTKENSPLLSNSITSLAMNDETGELFVGTQKGIISYRTEATGGAKEHNDVYAYPNPVKPGYNGKIAIKGLVTDANVKITDVSGNLIYQTVANGGQAVWDGKNFEGERAHSGVYLVFSSDEKGEETFVTKILFLR